MREDANKIYPLLIEHGDVDLLQKVNFFDSELKAFSNEELITFLQNAHEKVIELIPNSQRLVEIYLTILATNKNEKKVLDFINIIQLANNNFDEKVNEIKNQGNSIYNDGRDVFYTDERTYRNYTNWHNIPKNYKKFLGRRPANLLSAYAPVIIDNLSIDFAKKYIELRKASLSEDIIKSITKRNYQELYSLFSIDDLTKYNGLIIQYGDYKFIADKVDIHKIDINELIKANEYEAVIKIITQVNYERIKLMELKKQFKQTNPSSNQEFI